MNGYSRITHSGLQKSRSSDFSDLVFFPPNHTARMSQQPGQAPTMMMNCNARELHQGQGQEPDDGVGEIFGVILGRRYSASSASFHGVSGCEKHMSSAAAAAAAAAAEGGCAVKRAFSMRRSSSVTEGYSRIHHQCGCDDDDDDDGGGGAGGLAALQRRSKKKKKKSNILKACRRLFGF